MTKSFDEYFNENFEDGLSSPSKYILRHTFEAGQQSKQAEIDELQNKYDAMYRAFTVADDCRKEWHRCYVGVCQREGELQKRIDGALKELEYIHFYKTQNSNNAIKILKGDSHES